MKFKHISFLVALLFTLNSNLIFADDAREIKNIVYDIAKYEKQFAGKTTARKNNVKRALKLLNITRQRLDKLSNKSSDSWKQTDTRYNNLVTQLKGFLLPNKKIAVTNKSNTTSVKKSTSPARSASSKMISQQRVRIKKIKRDIESVIAVLDKGGVKPFQNKDYINKYKKSYQRHQQSVAKYSQFSGDADVKAAKASLKAMANMLTFGQQYAAKNASALGDVQARLKAIDAKMHAMKIPTIPSLPLAQGISSTWLDKLSVLRTDTISAYKELTPIKEQAHLPNNRFTVQSGADYDMNDVLRMQRGLKDTASKIKGSISTLSSNIEANIKMIYPNLSRIDLLNPMDSDAQSNSFLGKGSAKKVRDSLQKNLDLVTESSNFAHYLKQEVSIRKKQILSDKIKRSMNLYEENHKLALELVRLPKAVSTDATLIATAKETLTNGKYGVGQIKRLVINSDKVHRSKTTSTAEFDDVDVSLSGKITLKGTQTTYHYEWDEYQVTTVEPDSGKLYLFYNSLKYYTSGSTTTPLNKWILSKRIQGSEIPEANLNK